MTVKIHQGVYQNFGILNVIHKSCYINNRMYFFWFISLFYYKLIYATNANTIDFFQLGQHTIIFMSSCDS